MRKRFVMVVVLALLSLALGCAPESGDGPLGEAQEALVTFTTHQVFDPATGLSANEQRGTDPFVRVLPNGTTIYVAATSFPHDPFLSDGGSLWRSADAGASWTYLGTANVADHMAAETAMDIDASGRLWMAELHPGADVTPIYRYDNPGAIVHRATDYSALGFGTPAGERPWISEYGSRIHVQYGEALIEPGVRISLDGGANPPVFTPTIPIAQTPVLRAEVAMGTGGGTNVLGIGQGPLSVNHATGHMCAPLVTVNGSSADYMPSHSLWTACSDDGLVWTNTLVYHNAAVSLMNFWPSSAIDAAGNMYFALAANMDATGLVSTGMAVFLWSSTDGGVTWAGPKKVSSGAGTNVFPVLAAGCAGGVDVAWYGTATAGNPSTVPLSTTWRIYLAQTKNALAASPTWTQVDAGGQVVHTGTVNQKGSFNTGADYRILTIPGLTVDGAGAAHVVWQDTSGPWSLDPNAFPTAQYFGNPAWGPLYHSRQSSGPELDTCN